jgi:hypothetical protein
MVTTDARVLGEIRQRLADMAGSASGRGEQVVAPLLILGTSERVGSNWVSDMLRPAAAQHNEPFRQQIGPRHPWSALNPQLTSDSGRFPAADSARRQGASGFLARALAGTRASDSAGPGHRVPRLPWS